jgi:hypothetical protein
MSAFVAHFKKKNFHGKHGQTDCFSFCHVQKPQNKNLQHAQQECENSTSDRYEAFWNYLNHYSFSL